MTGTSRRVMLGAGAAGAAALVTMPRRASAALPVVRVGALQFGSLAWELDVIARRGLDRAAGFELVVQPHGSGDAADIALMGDAADVIVEDWLWVSRQRTDGAAVTFIPYSSSVGVVMVRADSKARSLADLAGGRMGVAGGQLDKGWLILQAYARQSAGLDLAAVAKPAYGAPPLLNEKLVSGELPAVLTYWNWAARLEAKGHRRLMGINEAQAGLGVPADTPQLGYVVKQELAEADPAKLLAFVAAARAGKAVLDTDDAEWERLRPLTRAEDDATLAVLRQRWREGVVRRWGPAERADAANLYEILAKLGGPGLVGGAATLAPGTFWDAVTF